MKDKWIKFHSILPPQGNEFRVEQFRCFTIEQFGTQDQYFICLLKAKDAVTYYLISKETYDDLRKQITEALNDNGSNMRNQ